jgi:hypothetical protein
VEALLAPKIFRLLSDDFKLFYAGKHRKFTEIQRKNLQIREH